MNTQLELDDVRLLIAIINGEMNIERIKIIDERHIVDNTFYDHLRHVRDILEYSFTDSKNEKLIDRVK